MAVHESSALGRHSSWLGIAILLAVLIAYAPALNCGYIWDDDDYILHNDTLRSLSGLWQIWFELGAVPQYYPLVHTTYWLEFQAWGTHPAGYHLLNILLHAASAILLWRILTRLEVPGAWLAAAIFALHPVHVESVAWMTERKNTLSGLFYLLAAMSYFRADLRFSPQREESEDQNSMRWGWYLASWFLYAAALLSKTVTITLPAAILLMIWWKEGSISRKDFVRCLPMLLVGLPLAWLTVWMEQHYVGIKHIDLGLEPVDRLLIAGRALCFYAEKIIWPVDLAFIYPRWNIDSTDWSQYLFPLFFSGVLLVLWGQRRTIGRGPLVACLFFAGTVSPALGFVDVYPMRFSFVADHFQYLASIGLITLLACLLRQWILVPLRRNRSLILLFMLGLLSVLATLTWRQCGIYKDLKTLWSDTLRKNPHSAMVHHNLATVFADNGEYQQAISHFQRTLELDPDDTDSHYNLGVAFSKREEWEQAVVHLTRTLEMGHLAPAVYRNRGRAYLNLGQLEHALEDYTQLVEAMPVAFSFAERAKVYARMENWTAVVADCDAALNLVADRASILLQRGVAKLWLGRDVEAQSDFSRCVSLQPGAKNFIAQQTKRILQDRAGQRDQDAGPPGG